MPSLVSPVYLYYHLESNKACLTSYQHDHEHSVALWLLTVLARGRSKIIMQAAKSVNHDCFDSWADRSLDRW